MNENNVLLNIFRVSGIIAIVILGFVLFTDTTKTELTVGCTREHFHGYYSDGNRYENDNYYCDDKIWDQVVFHKVKDYRNYKELTIYPKEGYFKNSIKQQYDGSIRIRDISKNDYKGLAFMHTATDTIRGKIFTASICKFPLTDKYDCSGITEKEFIEDVITVFNYYENHPDARINEYPWKTFETFGLSSLKYRDRALNKERQRIIN